MLHAANLSPLLRFVSMRDLLDLFTLLRDFREPLASPEGLQRAIQLLLKIGESLGIDPALLARLRSIAEEPHVFEILLAVLRYALSLFDQTPQSTGDDTVTRDNISIQSLSLADWFAIVMQLIELLRRLRQQQTS